MNAFLTPEKYGELKTRYPRFNEAWTQEETEDLIEMFNCELTQAEMSTHLGRTPNSVKMKLKALGLYTPRPAPRPWTPEDDALLVELYRQDVPYPELAETFDRSERAILSRLVRLRAGLRPDTCD
ncbi:MAG: hypothetical protein J5490_06435 [Bacteroidales bacterium]|jgi:hypothetical protein|nr:hypothetical protein [Bacteroidales bacterium]